MKMKDFKRTLNMVNRFVNDLSADDMLGYVGLQRRRSAIDYVLPAVGLVGVGVAVGVGIGIALAPKPGAELRNDVKQDLKQRVNDIRDRVSSAGIGANASVGMHS